MPRTTGDAELEEKRSKGDARKGGTCDTKRFGQEFVLHGEESLFRREILHVSSNSMVHSDSEKRAIDDLAHLDSLSI